MSLHVSKINLNRSVLKKIGIFLLIVLAIVLVFFMPTPKPNNPSSYSVVTEGTKDTLSLPKLIATDPVSGTPNSYNGIKFKFSQPVLIESLSVSVSPIINVKLVTYKDPTEIWVLPTGGSNYWVNGVTYQIAITNRDSQNPAINSNVLYVHNYQYSEDGVLNPESAPQGSVF